MMATQWQTGGIAMTRIATLFAFLLAVFLVAAPARAAIGPGDDPTIIEGIREKGIDWLKDKASGAGQDWLFETGQSETMHEILLKAREAADGPGNDQNAACKGVVMGKASSILNDINYGWSVKTGGKLVFDTVTKMAGLASGLGGAAAEGGALNWLAEQYLDAAKGEGKDAVFDAIKKLFGKEKKPEFELYETEGTNGPCKYTLRAMWDIVHGTYRVYIAGDCGCKTIGSGAANPQRVGKWWISFEGHLKLNVDKQKKTASWTPLARRWISTRSAPARRASFARPSPIPARSRGSPKRQRPARSHARNVTRSRIRSR